MAIYYWIILLVVWFGTGILAACLSYAYFQRKYALITDITWKIDTVMTWILVLFGPIGLIVALMQGGTTYGLMFPGTRDKK